MNFFLDIFNQLLKINEQKIFIIFDIDNNIWFKFKDVLKVLGYTSTLKQSNIFNINKEYLKKFISIPHSAGVLSVLHPTTSFINESGLYDVLSKSNKPLAKIFMDKYFKEIMPEIRKNGKYIVNDKDKKKLEKLNTKIDNYKQELIYYYDKYEFIPSSNGYFYINEDKISKNGKKITCYKIGYCKDMKKRMNNYKTGNFNYKPIAYLTLDFTNGKEIEDCVKSNYKSHIIKLKTDTICHINLTKLKDKILKCMKDITTHICHCMICKKTYKFKNLDNHKCYNKNKFVDIVKKSKKISN
jgi:prophage antirepressor-like protein